MLLRNVKTTSRELLAAAKRRAEAGTTTAALRVRDTGETPEITAIGAAAGSAARVAAATNVCRIKGTIADTINRATTSRVTTNRAMTNRVTISRVTTNLDMTNLVPAGTMTVLIVRITPARGNSGSTGKMIALVVTAGIKTIRRVRTKAVTEHAPRIGKDAKIEGATALRTTTVVALGMITEVVKPVRVETMTVANSVVETRVEPSLTTTTWTGSRQRWWTAGCKNR